MTGLTFALPKQMEKQEDDSNYGEVDFIPITQKVQYVVMGA